MIDETTEEEFAQLLAGMVYTPPAPEFRLYYDENGKVLFYSCEKPEGNYLVIDKELYAESRHDLRIVDGVIHRTSEFAVITKLNRSNEGTNCVIEDISIIADKDYTGKTQTWKAETHEYKYS